MAKRLTEEAVELVEDYLTEDEDIAELYEAGEIDESDILRLHHALSVVDEWDDLLEQYIPVQNKGGGAGSYYAVKYPQFSKDVRTTKGARKAAREGKLKKLNPNRLQRVGKYIGKHKGKFGAGAAAATAAGIGAAAYHRRKKQRQGMQGAKARKKNRG